MLKFRSLTDDDIPLVERWLHQAHVERWYAIPRLGVTIDDWINEIKAYIKQLRVFHLCYIPCSDFSQYNRNF